MGAQSEEYQRINPSSRGNVRAEPAPAEPGAGFEAVEEDDEELEGRGSDDDTSSSDDEGGGRRARETATRAAREERAAGSRSGPKLYEGSLDGALQSTSARQRRVKVHKPLGQRADADAAKKKRKAQEERRRREDGGSSTKKGRRGFDAEMSSLANKGHRKRGS